MKISGNILKAYESPAENKTNKKAIKKSENPESTKSDTLSISSNKVKEVSFPSFNDAKDLLSSIKQGINDSPELVKSLHEKSSNENVEFLLR